MAFDRLEVQSIINGSRSGFFNLFLDVDIVLILLSFTALIIRSFCHGVGTSKKVRKEENYGEKVVLFQKGDES